MSDKRSNVPIPLHSRRGFTRHVTELCNCKIEQYMECHGALDISDFSMHFNPFVAAQELYKNVPNVERYNTEKAKKGLFIQQIAYTIDRRIPYHLYAKHMELKGLAPKPWKNFAHFIFPKDSFKESSAKYTYKVDERELVEAYQFHTKSAGIAPAEVQKTPKHRVYRNDEESVNKPRNGLGAGGPDTGKRKQGKGQHMHKPVKENLDTPKGQGAVISTDNPVTAPPYISHGLKHTIMQIPERKRANGNFAALKALMGDEKILRFMEAHGYPEENFAVMAGDQRYIMKNFPWLLEEDRGKAQRRDKRKTISYLQNLVSGWIFESGIVENINNASGGRILVELNGSDKDRVIATDVTQRPDFIIHCDGISRMMECSMSHTGYFYYNEQINLRGNKRENILKHDAFSLAIETFILADSTRKHAMDMCKLGCGLQKRAWKFAVQEGTDLDTFVTKTEDECGLLKQSDAVYVGMESFHGFHEFLEMIIKKMHADEGDFNKDWAEVQKKEVKRKKQFKFPNAG